MTIVPSCIYRNIEKYHERIVRINGDGVGLEANLGYSEAADYGLETLGLGYVADGPTLENMTVAGIATTSPFYL